MNEGKKGNSSAGFKVPLSSWMAYVGGIDSTSPPFGGVDWENMKSPWSSNLSGGDGEVRHNTQGRNVALVAKARE